MKPALFKTAVLLASFCAQVHATGLSSLERFVKNVNTGRAEFTQVVTSPPKDGQAARSKTSSGSFEFSRPNRFKFIYKKPFAQSIVADGQTLWLYDVDLNQVTARQQAKALGATPAALIAAAPDLRALQVEYTLSDEPDKDGLQWLAATPKSKDNPLQSVRIGFKADVLAELDMLDSFGQKSVIRFLGFEANVKLSPGSFEFKPPVGADVIRQ
jgi:outer membrane lipoprotein carrier protein